MTLVIALKWIGPEGEGIVMSSDSKASAGIIAYEVKKIYPIVINRNGKEIDLAVAGGAGDSSLVKQGYEIADAIIKKFSEKVGFRNLTKEEFKSAIDEIEDNLIRRFSYLRTQGIRPQFEMILGSIDPQEKKALLYQFNDYGLAEPVHEDPGFAIIGSGAVTGGLLLAHLLGYSAERSSELDLGIFSTFIIDMVSKINPTVGPFVDPENSIYMRIEKGQITMGPLKVEALKEYKEKVERRKELIKLLWQLTDQCGEEEIKKKLEEFLKINSHKI
jgi:hypothetical protein